MAIDARALKEISQKVIKELISADGPYPLHNSTIFDNKIHNVRLFGNAPNNMKDLLFPILLKYPKVTALIFERERLTMAEVHQRVNTLISTLRSWGLKKGDRVAISMKNNAEWCISFLAIACSGYIAVALNSLWKSNEMEYGLSDSTPSVLVCDLDRFKNALPYLKNTAQLRVILAREGFLPASLPSSLENRVFLWEDVMKARVPFSNWDDIAMYPDDSCIIMYTSGSSGFPKGVLLTHRAFISQLVCHQMYLEARNRLIPPSPRPQVEILAVPLFHITGLLHSFLFSMMVPSTLIIIPKWNPSAVLAIMEREHVTSIVGVPTMTQDLLESPDFERRDLSSLEVLRGGGSAMPPSAIEKVKGKLPLVDFGQGYGMTELCGGIASINGIIYEEKKKSTGRPKVNIDAKVIDTNFNELPPGHRGELIIKGPVIMKEYWNKPEETRKTIITVNGDYGWLRTGDIAELDDEGYITIVDRAKEIIIRGGENISCAEVESAIVEHPSVLHCVAVPAPDKRLGEEVAVFIAPKEDHYLNVDELLKFTKERLASFKVPNPNNVYITPVIPKTGSEKFDKPFLKKLIVTLKDHKL